LIVWAISANVPLIGYSIQVNVWLLMLGIIPQLIGHSSANYVIRYMSPSIVSLAILGEPVGTSILSILFIHEWPTPYQVVGGSIILLGIAIPMTTELWFKHRSAAQPANH
jgi:drug/metabolite transporter (DMT)-like permease